MKLLLTGALAAAIAAVPTGTRAPTPGVAAPCELPADSAAYEGEAGLWVERAGDSLLVHWLTRDSAPGLLVVEGGGSAPASLETAAGHAHRAVFPGAGEEAVTLRLGTAGRLHEITIEAAAQEGRQPVEVPAPDSLFVVGDVHGSLDHLAGLLQNAGLVDRDLRWRGGRAHLAFDGDLVDRGPDATAVLWLVHRLEREAAAAGGRVHVLLGNHEIMAIAGDQRYVHPKELRIAACHGVPYRRLFDPARSVLGRWLASKPGILKIGDALLAHGGVAPRWAEPGLQAFDDSLAVFLHEDLMTAWFDSTAATGIDSLAYDRRYDMFWDGESVFWHRGYVQSDTLGAALQRVLDAFDARIHLVGHTPIDTIELRYGGRLVALHPRDFATEMVLLTREGADRAIWRYRLAGLPERLD